MNLFIDKLTKFIGFYTVFFLVISLSACGGGGSIKKNPSQDGAPSNKNVNVSKIPNAVPKKERRSKYGNPKSYDVFGKRYYVMDSAIGYRERGDASWYGTKFHGRRTSSGETYDMYAMTAAHKSLPLPTYVKVTNLQNNKSIIVKVNDRGPFHEGRIIDLSYVAALKLDVVKTGTAPVEVEAITPGYKSEPKSQVVQKKHIPKEIVKVNRKPSNGFYIQAGSFSLENNAQRLRDKLSTKTAHLVSIKKSIVDNKPWYRVLIGPVSNAKVANTIVSTLESEGISNPNFISN